MNERRLARLSGARAGALRKGSKPCFTHAGAVPAPIHRPSEGELVPRQEATTDPKVTYRIEATLARGKQAPHPSDVEAALEYARRNDIEGAQGWSAARVRSFAVIGTTNAGARCRLDDRELATVLAALRGWQHSLGTRYACSAPFTEIGQEIATDGNRFEPLAASEIDSLCERLNTGG